MKDGDNVQQLHQEQTDENTKETKVAQDINSIVSDVLQYCDENQNCSTKEVIRLLQSKTIIGRSLEIENENENEGQPITSWFIVLTYYKLEWMKLLD